MSDEQQPRTVYVQDRRAARRGSDEEKEAAPPAVAAGFVVPKAVLLSVVIGLGLGLPSMVATTSWYMSAQNFEVRRINAELVAAQNENKESFKNIATDIKLGLEVSNKHERHLDQIDIKLETLNSKARYLTTTRAPKDEQ